MVIDIHNLFSKIYKKLCQILGTFELLITLEKQDKYTLAPGKHCLKNSYKISLIQHFEAKGKKQDKYTMDPG